MHLVDSLRRVQTINTRGCGDNFTQMQRVAQNPSRLISVSSFDNLPSERHEDHYFYLNDTLIYIEGKILVKYLFGYKTFSHFKMYFDKGLLKQMAILKKPKSNKTIYVDSYFENAKNYLTDFHARKE